MKIRKKGIACVLTVLCICSNSYNLNTIYASENEKNIEEGAKIEILDMSGEEHVIEYNSDNVFSEEFRDDLVDSSGIILNYDDISTLENKEVNEIVENGTVVIVKVNDENQAKTLLNTFDDSDFGSVETDLEKVKGIILTEYNGDMVVGYVGETYSDGEVKKESEVEIDLKKTIEMIEENQNYSVKSKENELGIEKEEDLKFQIPNLATCISPRTYITNLMWGDTKVAQSSLTAYCYRGQVYKSGTTKTSYNYVIASMQIAPDLDYYVSEFTGRLGSSNSQTKIIDAQFLDDKEAVMSYTIGSEIGADSSGSLSSNINSSITNTYSTSSMDIIERFSHQNDNIGYCDWYVKPEKEMNGQARKIEPAIVTRTTSSLTCVALSIPQVQIFEDIFWEFDPSATWGEHNIMRFSFK